MTFSVVQHLSVVSLGSINIYQLQFGLERVLLRTAGRECQRCVSQTEDTVKLFICWDHFDSHFQLKCYS